ncbi:hypothetical protein CIB95_11690 [Lottiidibacillus patelloidae]|uniref:Uncharacterized protein n=1 Tax=Lottiidibacillus patelloidae TaxID=2670334 RepID=A0A263BRU4_9BACI|nr:hypothetical protein [Lottiidibacillus patelloidae]OZM56430.1 hypothetical protein CIB95_11690 [Lottiidibacillus patelloidae]
MSNFQQQQELRQMRCCVYLNNQSGRFTAFCTPVEASGTLCPERQGHTVVMGFTFGTTLPPGQACEGCRDLGQAFNQMNMFNDMTIEFPDHL